MTNLHTLIVGRTGSGKTTLARALLNGTARAVIFDRRFEKAYGSIPGAIICVTLESAVAVLMEREWRQGIIVCRFREPLEYLDMLEVCMLIQDSNPLYGPLVVVMEEASTYSETFSIDPRVRTAYNQGRHMRLSLLTVIQLDTDIHRVTRANSEIIVSMAQNRMSTDMSRYFAWDTIANLQSLRDNYTPEPIQNVHFATYPPDIDLYMEWYKAHGYINEQTTALSTPVDNAQEVS